MASTVPHTPSERLSIGGPNGCAVSDDRFKINCFRSMFAPDLPKARSRCTACTYVDVRGERRAGRHNLRNEKVKGSNHR